MGRIRVDPGGVARAQSTFWYGFALGVAIGIGSVLAYWIVLPSHATSDLEHVHAVRKAQ